MGVWSDEPTLYQFYLQCLCMRESGNAALSVKRPPDGGRDIRLAAASDGFQAVVNWP